MRSPAACQKDLTIGSIIAPVWMQQIAQARDEKRVFRLLNQSIKYRLVIIYVLGFVCLASNIAACGSLKMRPAQVHQCVAQLAVRRMDLLSRLRAPHWCAARPPNASSLHPKINCQSYRLKHSRQLDKT
jgi:hypothetical protein